MRNILVVVREIEEVKEKIHNVNSKTESKALKNRLADLQKERQAINWR